MIVSAALILLVSWKGQEWRIRAEERETREGTSGAQK